MTCTQGPVEFRKRGDISLVQVFAAYFLVRAGEGPSEHRRMGWGGGGGETLLREQHPVRFICKRNQHEDMQAIDACSVGPVPEAQRVKCNEL